MFHAGVVAASHNVVLKGLTGTIEAALRATFAITNRRLASAQSRALAAHRAVFERIRMRDGEGARLATIELLEIAARDLDRKLASAAGAPGPAKRRRSGPSRTAAAAFAARPCPSEPRRRGRPSAVTAGRP